MYKLKKLFKQILKFGIIGLLATLLEWGLFYLFSEFFNIYYLISVIIAYSFSTVFNYIFSVIWVFNVEKNNEKKFVIFLICSLIGLTINEVLMLVFVELFMIYTFVSKIIATLIVMIYNFITRKIFVEDRY